MSSSSIAQSSLKLIWSSAGYVKILFNNVILFARAIQFSNDGSSEG